MRRGVGLVSIVAVMLLGIASIGGLYLNAGAQDATPPSEGFEIAPGVTAEAIAFIEGREDPSVYRLHFAPGVTYSFEAAPSLDLVYVESGSLTFILDAPVTVAQVGNTEAGGELVPPDTEFTLAAGDHVVFTPFIAGEVRNDGSETATVTVAGIVPEELATPTAGTPAA